MEHSGPRIIQLPKILDDRGNLSFLEENNHVPFDIKRIYCIYDVPGGEIRGGHSYKKQQEIIIAISGSFNVVLHNGKEEYTFSLKRSYYALYVPKMIWRTMNDFSTNAVCMVIASTVYDESDYIRDFEYFKSKV
jgi:dTDP-4-dehydrorhamnose 3,5-epimerase-like enzyme